MFNVMWRNIQLLRINDTKPHHRVQETIKM
jgi:hypothetical protein